MGVGGIITSAGVDLCRGDGVASGAWADCAGVGVATAVAVGVALGPIADEDVAVGVGVNRRAGMLVFGGIVAGELGEADAACAGGGVALLSKTGVAVAVAVGGALATEGAGVVSCGITAGFTNVLDGASDGGGASDFILVRAFSTAERSEISSQP